jgi:hypothetical protein
VLFDSLTGVVSCIGVFHVVHYTLLGVTCQGLNLEEISSSVACP